MPAFGKYSTLQEFLSAQAKKDPFSRWVNSIIAKTSGSELTGAELQANAFTSQENAIVREFNAEQAQKQMDFQASMANTQYQRAVADMQAAGINPALAMSQGGNAAPTGAAASASGVQSVSPQSGMSMSDLLAFAKLRSEMRLLDKQAENVAADTEKKGAESRRIVLESEWLPKIYAADLDLKEGTLEKYSAEVASLLASAEGQRILNEWNPKIFASQLENDRINRLHTVAGIHKIEQEIKNLVSENENILQDTEVKRLTQGLIAAQTSLASQQVNEVSARTWRQEFENAFTQLYGHKPDEPIWNAVTSLLTESGASIRNVLENPGKLFSSSPERFRNNN